MIPPVPATISQRKTFTKDDGQQLIREQSIRKSASRRPKFSVRPRKSKGHQLKSKKAKTEQIQQCTSTQLQHPVLWDAFMQSDPVSETGKNTKKKTKKRKISFKIVRKAGQRIEWLLKKGAKYFGIAIIKVFNQPGLYTEDSRTCVV